MVIAIKLRLLLLTVLLPLMCGGADPTKDERMRKAQDKELVAKVRRAFLTAPRPTTVESVVGIRAAINTTRPFEQLRFFGGDFEDDKDENQKIPDLRKMRHVVYWVRPIKNKSPKIVGICWDRLGKPIFFFGLVITER
jgi:hypothetical protein